MNERASGSNSDRANYWDDLLRDRYEIHQVEEFTAMGKGKRSRKQVFTWPLLILSIKYVKFNFSSFSILLKVSVNFSISS